MKNKTDDNLQSVMRYYAPRERHNPKTQRFIFATRIECSYPTIQIMPGKNQMKLFPCI